MNIGAHEVLGVLFQDVIDLIEQIVGLLGQLLAALLAARLRAAGVVVLATAAATLGLLLSHRCLLIARPVLSHYRSTPVMLGIAQLMW